MWTALQHLLPLLAWVVLPLWFAVLIIWVVRSIRQSRREMRDAATKVRACMSCGYDVGALDRCPECGRDQGDEPRIVKPS